MITTEALKQINEKLEGIPVKGKNYVEVNTRVKAFRELCPEGMISTEFQEWAQSPPKADQCLLEYLQEFNPAGIFSRDKEKGP